MLSGCRCSRSGENSVAASTLTRLNDDEPNDIAFAGQLHRSNYLSNHFLTMWTVAARPARAMLWVNGISFGHTETQF